jgi:excisionase family DNA binding protein
MITHTHNSRNADKVPATTLQPQSTTSWLNGIPAVADYTGCSRRTVQNWISSGELPVKRLSKRHLLARPVDVDELIDRLDREYRERISDEEEIYMEELV